MRRATLSIAVSVGLAALVAALAVPRPGIAGNSGIGRNEGIAAKAGKAGSIAALARMYDSGPCAACHRAIYDQWRSSAHAESVFGAGRTAEGIRAAIVDGLMQWPYSGVKSGQDVTVDHLMGCARCHLPQLADADDGVARELVAAISGWRSALDNNNAAAARQAADSLKSLNVGCLVCHNRNAVIHKWADGYPKAGEVYGSKDGAHSGTDFRVLKKSPIMRESIMCGQCHGVGPTLNSENPTQCATTYGSYLYAYRAEGGTESCQDCHMRRSKLGHATRSGADPATAAQALDFTAEARGFQWRDGSRLVPRIAVEVAMTNKAGHSIPGSGAGQKRLVLEVTAKAGGTEVFSKARTYAAIAQRLGRGGSMVRGPYEGSGIIEDTALPPNRTVRERFDIVLEAPESAASKESRTPAEVAVNVKLRLVDPGAGAKGSVWHDVTKVVKLEDAP